LFCFYILVFLSNLCRGISCNFCTNFLC